MQNFGTDMMAGMMTEQAPSPQPQMMPAGRPTPQGGGMPKWFEILMSMLQQQGQNNGGIGGGGGEIQQGGGGSNPFLHPSYYTESEREKIKKSNPNMDWDAIWKAIKEEGRIQGPSWSDWKARVGAKQTAQNIELMDMPVTIAKNDFRGV